MVEYLYNVVPEDVMSNEKVVSNDNARNDVPQQRQLVKKNSIYDQRILTKNSQLM